MFVYRAVVGGVFTCGTLGVDEEDIGQPGRGAPTGAAFAATLGPAPEGMWMMVELVLKVVVVDRPRAGGCRNWTGKPDELESAEEPSDGRRLGDLGNDRGPGVKRVGDVLQLQLGGGGQRKDIGAALLGNKDHVSRGGGAVAGRATTRPPLRNLPTCTPSRGTHPTSPARLNPTRLGTSLKTRAATAKCRPRPAAHVK
ncbi:hypothetical protein OPV22_006977 [Ensete ventricosum]|uniref:Uncharacterized protein n=1 Tax=Ensete ventricosum TaxID=4639 RepID=A0AAV8RLZ0_ENSVE|nr:hypothetical protein OPV22_006977 [Ensete ventricosum]